MLGINFPAISVFVITIIVLSGCASNGSNSQTNPISIGVHDKTQTPSPFELLEYDWKKYRITVSFARQHPGQTWIMTINDTLKTQDQAKQVNFTWGLSRCLCSTNECVAVIDSTLADFRKRRPDARLNFVSIEMQIDKELWRDILTALSTKLSTVHEEMLPAVNIPKQVSDGITSVFDTSSSIAEIQRALRLHGLVIRAVSTATEIQFNTCKGRKWSQVSISTGIGVWLPGTIEFDLIDQQRDGSKD